MENPFKNNSLASGLFGYVMGLLTILGGQALTKDSGLFNSSDSHQPPISGFVDNSFHGLENDASGDVIITPSGKCYHSPYGCRTLSNSRNVRTVTREDAEAKGLTPCSRCCP